MRRSGAARSLNRALGRTGKVLALAIIAIWSLGPVLLCVAASFRPDREIFDPTATSFTLTLVNYRNLVAQWGEFFHGLGNSVAVTLGATIVATVASALAGYASSRLQRRWTNASVTTMVM